MWLVIDTLIWDVRWGSKTLYGKDSEKDGVTVEKVLIGSLLIAYPDRLQHMYAPFYGLIDCITQFKLNF